MLVLSVIVLVLCEFELSVVLLEPVAFVVSDMEIFRVLNELSKLVVSKLDEVFFNIVEFNVELI